MINKISSAENRYKKPVKFTGYATVTKKSMHTVNDLFVGKILMHPELKFIDNLAMTLRKPTSTLKEALNISAEKELELNKIFDNQIDDTFKLVESMPDSSDEDVAVAMDKQFKDGILNLLKKENFINDKNEFFTLPARTAVLKEGTDYIPDDLSLLADRVIVKGNVNFKDMFGGFIALNNVKNSKLYVQAETVFANNSSLNSIITEIGSYGKNIKAHLVQSDGEINILGENKIDRVWADGKIDIAKLIAKKMRSEKESITIHGDSKVDFIDVFKNFEAKDNLTSNKITTQVGEVKLLGEQNNVQTIESVGNVEARNLTSDIVDSYKGTIVVKGLKNELNQVKAKFGIMLMNSKTKFIESIFSHIHLLGTKNSAEEIKASDNIIINNLRGAKSISTPENLYLLGCEGDIKIGEVFAKEVITGINDTIRAKKVLPPS